MKRSPRKPRTLTADRTFPRWELKNGRIRVQNSPSGKIVKVPLGRARHIHDRIGRIIAKAKFLKKNKR